MHNGFPGPFSLAFEWTGRMEGNEVPVMKVANSSSALGTLRYRPVGKKTKGPRIKKT